MQSFPVYHEHKPRRLRRITWAIVNSTLFRWLPGRLCWPLRKGLLRLFGARLGRGSYVYASARIFAPWNLTMGRALIGPRTDIYNKATVTLGNNTVVSQDACLCTASHDITLLDRPLLTAPILAGDHVWVAARAFIGPGVTLGDGVVVGATASVFRSVAPWTVVGGNPAVPIKSRKLKPSHQS